MRIQQADDSESEIQEGSSADYGGCADVAAKSCWRTTGGWLRAAGVVAGGNAKSLATDSLLPPPIDGLMNGLPLALSYWHMYVTPTRSRTALI